LSNVVVVVGGGGGFGGGDGGVVNRRSVSAGRGPVQQVGPGQSVAVYVIVGLFAVSVRRFGRTVRGRRGLVARLCTTGRTKTKNRKPIVLETCRLLR